MHTSKFPLTSWNREDQAFQKGLFVMAQFESYRKVDHCFSDWLKRKMQWVQVNRCTVCLCQTVIALQTMEAQYTTPCVHSPYVHTYPSHTSFPERAICNSFLCPYKTCYGMFGMQPNRTSYSSNRGQKGCVT